MLCVPVEVLTGISCGRGHRAHGQSFHISIWYVSVAGITEPLYVERIRVRYDEVGF